MANTSQARKRARQGESRRRHNASFRSMVRTCIKKVNAAIEGGDYKAATEAYIAAVPVIDRMADKPVRCRRQDDVCGNGDVGVGGAGVPQAGER